jgi:cob(I)alamin adenosyltransferase
MALVDWGWRLLASAPARRMEYGIPGASQFVERRPGFSFSGGRMAKVVNRKRPDRLLIFTGEGKGKTTAALGMALRAVGHGMTVLIVQFLKNDSSTGEIAALAGLPGVELVQCGHGFLPRTGSAGTAAHREAAERALDRVAEALAGGRYRLVILDEVAVAIQARLVEEAAVEEAVRAAAPGVTVVLTGRGAPPELVALADTVTEMRCLKHGYKAGIPAQAGVEF